MKVQMTTEVGPFDGTPTAADLIAALGVLPGEAYVNVQTWDSQMEGAGWRISSRWTEER